MAKKIRFPLKMKDDVEVRTMDELLENFSIVPVLEYLENGKLKTWLLNCYEEDIAAQLDVLELNDADLAAKVCAIFGVEFNASETEDMEKIQERNRKIALLKERTDDDKYIDMIDQVAFDQNDLFDLLDEGETTIYLCGDSFSIPWKKKGVTYIGINHPVVKIASKTVVDWTEQEITLTNVCFDDTYQAVLSEATKSAVEDEQAKERKENVNNPYIEFFKKIVKADQDERFPEGQMFVNFSDYNKGYHAFEDARYTLLGYDKDFIVYSVNHQGNFDHERIYECYRASIATGEKSLVDDVPAYIGMIHGCICQNRLFVIKESTLSGSSADVYVEEINGNDKRLLKRNAKIEGKISKIAIENGSLAAYCEPRYKNQEYYYKRCELYNLKSSSEWKKNPAARETGINMPLNTTLIAEVCGKNLILPETDLREKKSAEPTTMEEYEDYYSDFI